MKRVLIAATMAASLVATNLLAAETSGTLAPGKPAGVKQAQGEIGWGTAAWVGIGVAAAIAVGLSTGQKAATGPVSTAGAAVTTST
jgi:hypothetical protein